jgi:hypothetical protein
VDYSYMTRKNTNEVYRTGKTFGLQEDGGRQIL